MSGAYYSYQLDAFVPGLSADERKRLVAEYASAGGSELKPRRGGAPKFQAAYSSAALAANTFGPFVARDAGVPFDGQNFRGDSHLECQCPTGLSGTPPTLDFLVDGEQVFAVESKFTETFDDHSAAFKPSYETVVEIASKAWRLEYERLLTDPYRYRFLDAAQLVKHYLGLKSCFPGRKVTLLYLFWEPTNAGDVAACRIHRAEIAEFEAKVFDPTVRFVPTDCLTLWAGWAQRKRPDWLPDHALALHERYALSL